MVVLLPDQEKTNYYAFGAFPGFPFFFQGLDMV
jgi:hypothetical protein